MAGIDAAVVLDVATGDEVFTLGNHRYSVNSVSWSPDGRWIATASGDSGVRVWNADSGTLEAELVGHTGVVVTVDWAGDSKRLVSGGSDGTAKLWEISGAVARELLTLSAQQTRSGTFAAFSPNGRQVMMGDADITAVKTWDVTLSGDAEIANEETDYLAPVDVAYLPDGRIVTPIDRGSVSIRDVDGGRSPTMLGPGGGSDQPVWRIAVTDDGSRIATVRNFSETVTAWDTESGDEVFEVAPAGEISAIDWSPDGRHLVASSFDGSTTVLDARGRTVQVLDEGRGDEVEDVAFSPDGRTMATASFNQFRPQTARVTLWDWERAQRIRTIELRGPTVVQFDPTGSTIAVGRFDGFVEVRSVPEGELLFEFAAHSGGVDGLAFSPDGTRIATSGQDATVRLFDADDGTQQLVLRGHDYLVSGLAFSPDGTRLVSAAPDGIARVWELDLDDLIAIAEGEVTRGFTDDECRQYLHLEACP